MYKHSGYDILLWAMLTEPAEEIRRQCTDLDIAIRLELLGFNAQNDALLYFYYYRTDRISEIFNLVLKYNNDIYNQAVLSLHEMPVMQDHDTIPNWYMEFPEELVLNASPRERMNATASLRDWFKSIGVNPLNFLPPEDEKIV